MSGSFTWSAIVRIGSINAYKKATTITVVHEYATRDDRGSWKTVPVWNTVVCFKPPLRKLLESKLAEGDLVHLTGTVRTKTLEDQHEETWRMVDLVVSSFDLLQKHLRGPDEG